MRECLYTEDSGRFKALVSPKIYYIYLLKYVVVPKPGLSVVSSLLIPLDSLGR